MDVTVLWAPGTWSKMALAVAVAVTIGPHGDSCVPRAALSLHLFCPSTANAILISI